MADHEAVDCEAVGVGKGLAVPRLRVTLCVGRVGVKLAVRTRVAELEKVEDGECVRVELKVQVLLKVPEAGVGVSERVCVRVGVGLGVRVGFPVGLEVRLPVCEVLRVRVSVWVRDCMAEPVAVREAEEAEGERVSLRVVVEVGDPVWVCGREWVTVGVAEGVAVQVKLGDKLVVPVPVSEPEGDRLAREGLALLVALRDGVPCRVRDTVGGLAVAVGVTLGGEAVTVPVPLQDPVWEWLPVGVRVPVVLAEEGDQDRLRDGVGVPLREELGVGVARTDGVTVQEAVGGGVRAGEGGGCHVGGCAGGGAGG